MFFFSASGLIISYRLLASATIENSVARMNRLLRQLQRGESSGPRQRVRLRAVLAEAIGQSENRRPEPVLVADDPDLYAELNRERFTAILAQLERQRRRIVVRYPTADGALAAFLHRRAVVIDEHYDAEESLVTIEADDRLLAELRDNQACTLEEAATG